MSISLSFSGWMSRFKTMLFNSIEIVFEARLLSAKSTSLGILLLRCFMVTLVFVNTKLLFLYEN